MGGGEVPLLKWGIEHSDAEALRREASEEGKNNQLDPQIVEMILGKSDAVRMRETTSIILDKEKTLEERLDALELLQDLVEPIDNANDMAKMDLWTSLWPLLQTPSPDDHDEILFYRGALRLVSIAARNNPEAANYFMQEKQLDASLIAYLETTRGEDDQTLRWILSALSPLVNISQLPASLSAWMEDQSLAVFIRSGSLRPNLSQVDDKESSSCQNRTLAVYSSYVWSQGRLPRCLAENPTILRQFQIFHCNNCDGLDCPAVFLHTSHH